MTISSALAGQPGLPASPVPGHRALRHSVLKRLAIGVIGGVLAFAAAAQGTLSKLTTSGPAMSIRSKPAAAAIGPNIYLFGGVHDDFTTSQYVFFNDLHRFDTRTNSWALLTPAGAVPPPRAFPAGVAVGHRQLMLVFGGAVYPPDNSSVIAFDDFWVYDVRRNEWSQVRADNPGPGGRVQPAMWQVGDRTYLFGGVNASFHALNDLWVFDLATNCWTQLIADGAPGSPPGRSGAMSGSNAVLGKLTLYGGQGGADIGWPTHPDTWQFDLLTSTWRDVTPTASANIPAHQSGAAVQMGLSLYVQGGELVGGPSGCGAGFPQNPTADMWRFDLARRTWVQVIPGGDALPRLTRTTGAAVGNRMYVFAGFDFTCSNGTGGQVWNDSVYSYTPTLTNAVNPADALR